MCPLRRPRWRQAPSRGPHPRPGACRENPELGRGGWRPGSHAEQSKGVRDPGGSEETVGLPRRAAWRDLKSGGRGRVGAIVLLEGAFLHLAASCA